MFLDRTDAYKLHTEHFLTAKHDGTGKSMAPRFANCGHSSEHQSGVRRQTENRPIQINYPGTGNSSSIFHDMFNRQAKIIETRAGSVTNTKQFLWASRNMDESLDGVGNLVSLYFEFGQTIAGASNFYAVDAFDSVRELTNSAGIIQAQYAYDPYGIKTVIQGAINSDFQYAGFYYHVPSSLDLGNAAAYSPSFGRILNRSGNIRGQGYTMNPGDPNNFTGKPVYVTAPMGILTIAAEGDPGGKLAVPGPLGPFGGLGEPLPPFPRIAQPGKNCLINLCACHGAEPLSGKPSSGSNLAKQSGCYVVACYGCYIPVTGSCRSGPCMWDRDTTCRLFAPDGSRIPRGGGLGPWQTPMTPTDWSSLLKSLGLSTPQ